MYETILVPTDGSDHARRAAEHALALAEAVDATVHLLSVYDVQAAAGPFDAGGASEQFRADLESEAQASVEALASLFEAVDAVETAVVEGDPAETIVEYADDHGIDLVAMGTHGRTGIRRYVAGSVTERVVRLADVPVLTARLVEGGPAPGSYDDVLVPTDGSEAAAVAFDHGIALAEVFDARVHAVSIIDVGDLANHPEVTPPTAVLKQLRAEREGATDAIAEQAREAGLEAVTHVEEGIPARDLLGYAEDSDVDLVAMGTAGRTGLNRYLLGSTTERFVRHAEMPVLAVDARDRAD